LETFETHYNTINATTPDGQVTLEEWTEYYRNVSSSIDDDEYFELMMNNSWNLKGNADPYAKYQKGWAPEQTVKPVQQDNEPLHKQEPIQRSGLCSSQNPLTTTAGYYKPVFSAALNNTTNVVMHSGPPVKSKVVDSYQKEVNFTHPQSIVAPPYTRAGVLVQGPRAMPKYQAILVEKFRSKLAARGNNGLIGLAAIFK